MIRVCCHTNLDLANEVWPSALPAVPRIGEEIQSKTKHGDFQLSLQVVKVRYQCNPRTEEWYPHIELHMTELQKMIPAPLHTNASAGSIVAFYHWYAPLVGRSAHAFI